MVLQDRLRQLKDVKKDGQKKERDRKSILRCSMGGQEKDGGSFKGSSWMKLHDRLG